MTAAGSWRKVALYALAATFILGVVQANGLVSQLSGKGQHGVRVVKVDAFTSSDQAEEEEIAKTTIRTPKGGTLLLIRVSGSMTCKSAGGCELELLVDDKPAQPASGWKIPTDTEFRQHAFEIALGALRRGSHSVALTRPELTAGATM